MNQGKNASNLLDLKAKFSKNQIQQYSRQNARAQHTGLERKTIPLERTSAMLECIKSSSVAGRHARTGHQPIGLERMKN
jgi:hypothetical protein